MVRVPHVTIRDAFGPVFAGFAGGELRLHDLRQREHVDVVPERDLLVAFPSWLTHEVVAGALPGRCLWRRQVRGECVETGRMGSAVDA
jgi:hypothetical protein